MSDGDGIEIRIRWPAPRPRPAHRFVIRHAQRTWSRIPRPERNRLRRGEEVRCIPRVKWRLTRKMRAMIAARTD